MSRNDAINGRPDFTLPPGKPLNPDIIVPEDDAALSEPVTEPGEDRDREQRGDRPRETPDDEHADGIPASWSGG